VLGKLFEKQIKMDCQLSIRVAEPDVFLDECRKREEDRRGRFQQNYTPEEQERKGKRVAELRARRRARRLELQGNQKNNFERDHGGFHKRIGDLHTQARKADGGWWSVCWGEQPSDKENWVVLSFDGDVAKCCFKMNMRVMDCWIAEFGAIIAVRLTNELIEEKEREFFVFLDQEGRAVGQAQFPTKWFQFL
jgi:hypothetical protein